STSRRRRSSSFRRRPASCRSSLIPSERTWKPKPATWRSTRRRPVKLRLILLFRRLGGQAFLVLDGHQPGAAWGAFGLMFEVQARMAGHRVLAEEIVHLMVHGGHHLTQRCVVNAVDG